jgi:hypothetical protein
MNILVDHHHGALLRSMYHLFRKRLNYNVYVPTGFEWRDIDGLYSCYSNRDTQYQMLNSWVYDLKFKSMFNPMTLDQFINSEIDVIICSLWDNYKFFESIINKYNKSCKIVLQVGNNLPPELINENKTKNLLSSAYPSYIKTDIPNKIFYHQEFDTDLFTPSTDKNIKSVANFKNIMENDVILMNTLEERLPDWEFKYYGANNRDGIIHDSEDEMSSIVNNFGFVFHVKKDEGYGHVIHNAFACGNPCIVDMNTARVNWNGEIIPNTASFLFEKNRTVIDSNDSIDEVIYNLKYMADNYFDFSKKVYDRFKEVVNFEEEASKIKQFMDNLI